MEYTYIIFSIALVIVVAVIIIALIVAVKKQDYFGGIFESPERRAGRIGEKAATDIIKSILLEDDFLITNAKITYGKQRTELDNIVINKYGVFIIEVKSYKGKLVGSENDYEWTKYHTTAAGNTYSKTVKNPIKQVKRQIHILAKYLNYCGIDVWITGYTFLLYGNSPVDSTYILYDIHDIDTAIHSPGKNRLSNKTTNTIANLLKK